MSRRYLLGLCSELFSRISGLEQAKEKLGHKAAWLLLFLMLESCVAISNQTEAINTL